MRIFLNGKRGLYDKNMKEGGMRGMRALFLQITSDSSSLIQMPVAPLRLQQRNVIRIDSTGTVDRRAGTWVDSFMC